jgi:signal transduction histidine kinase/HPt (histidine-containing phosphotransfer) domain-containing protein/ActR/RegA family two-component response regulator
MSSPSDTPHPDKRDRRITTLALALAAVLGVMLFPEVQAHLFGQSAWPLALTQALLLGCVGVALARLLRRKLRHRRRKAAAKRARDSAGNGIGWVQNALLFNMGLEVRTSSQGLVGMLNLLNTSTLSAQQRDQLETALDAAQALMNNLNSILDVAMLSSGGIQLANAPLDLHALVHGAQDQLRHSAGEKSVDLHIDLGEGVPRWVRGDALRLRQILVNLIGHAIGDTDAGEVRVQIGATASQPGQVTLIVEDTGRGLGQVALRRCESQNGRAPLPVGGDALPLGLAISHSLTRLMKGEMVATGMVGVGSRYHVTLELPVAPAQEETATPAPLAPPIAPTLPSRRLRLLVAEDHPINLKYMSLLLDKMGHDAVFCSRGHEVLDLVRRQAFDAVLLDYHMPDLDGIATAMALRAMPDIPPDLKLLLVTADVASEVVARASAAGMDLFVSKPLTRPDLEKAFADCGLLETECIEAAPLADWVPTEVIDVDDAPIVNLAIYRELTPYTTSNARAEMVHLILAPDSGSLDLLVDTLRTSDRGAIREAAHTLKGAALLLGMSGIGNAAATLEEMARRQLRIDSADWIDNLRRLGARSRHEVACLESLLQESQCHPD